MIFLFLDEFAKLRSAEERKLRRAREKQLFQMWEDKARIKSFMQDEGKKKRFDEAAIESMESFPANKLIRSKTTSLSTRSIPSSSILDDLNNLGNFDNSPKFQRKPSLHSSQKNSTGSAISETILSSKPNSIISSQEINPETPRSMPAPTVPAKEVSFSSLGYTFININIPNRLLLWINPKVV